MRHHRFFRRLAALLLAVCLLSACGMSAAAKTDEAAANATVLPDGEYSVDPAFFSFSGGTGKARFSCDTVIVREGKSYAVLSVSSDKYNYFRVGDETFTTTHGDHSSQAEIPFRLNTVNTVIGQTTAMSAAHEIEYKVFIYIPGALSAEDAVTKPEQLIPGLTFLSAQTGEKAQLYEIYTYQDGYRVLYVKPVGRFLLVPAGREVPEALDADVRVIRQPVKNGYIGDPDLYEKLLALEDAEVKDAFAFTGFQEEGMECLGDFQSLPLAKLLKAKCGLVLLPSAFADGRITGREDAPALPELDDDTAETLRKLYEALGEYGIPAFVDAAPLEESREAMLEWEALYRALFEAPEEEGADK